MNFERIKAIIQRYYEHHDSKYIFGGRRQDIDYFYNADNWGWYSDFVSKLGSELLNHEAQPDHVDFVFYTETSSKAKCDIMLKCSLKEYSTHDYYSMEFYAIKGLELRRFRGKPSLKLILEDKPLFNIQIRDDGEIYWSNRKKQFFFLKFNWWLNRLLQENDDFRMLMTDLLLELGEIDKNYILKDVARTIEKDRFFLPLINTGDLKMCHNPDQLIRYMTGRDTPVDFNRWDINCAYYVMRLIDYIDDEDKEILLHIPQDRLLSWIDNNVLLNGPQAESFAANYYADLLDGDQKRIRMLAADYARMCSETGGKVSLRKNSVNGLEREHDRKAAILMEKERTEEFSKPLIAENTCFMKLRSMLPEDFIWIDSTEALYAEGKKQHSCVYTYRDRIRRDECAIYHWSREGKEYTIEFTSSVYGVSDGEGRAYRISQMLQHCNEPASQQDIEIVESYLHAPARQFRDSMLWTTVRKTMSSEAARPMPGIGTDMC